MITIVVGPLSKPFNVYKEILCAESKYFAVACAERWFEDDGSIKLPDEDPKLFEELVKSLYSGEYTEKIERGEPEGVRRQFKLYVLADKLQLMSLTKEMEDWFDYSLYGRSHTEQGDYPYLGEVEYIYRHTSPASGLRKILAHSIARSLGDSMVQVEGLSQLWTNIPLFGTDLISELTRGIVQATREGRRSIRW